MIPSETISTRHSREAEHFDRLAEETGEIWWGSITPAGIERLKRRAVCVKGAIASFKDPYILELGCGTGAFTAPMLNEMSDLRILGIDVSPKTIDRIKKRLGRYKGAKFEVADSTNLPYGNSTFDAVVGNSVLHHTPLEEAVSEIYRVLKPGGVIWFSEPNMMNPQIALEKNVRFIGRWLQNSTDETAFFRWPLCRLLQKAGFEKVEVRPFDFLHPGIPRKLIYPADRFGKVLEQIPIIKEIAGSLQIRASKLQ